MQEAADLGPVEQPAGHADLDQRGVELAVEVAPPGVASEVSPGGESLPDEVLRDVYLGNRDVREALPGQADVGERVHHLHPGGHLPKQGTRRAVVRQVLVAVGLVGDVEEAVVQDPLGAEEALELGEELGEEAAVGAAGGGGLGRPEQLAVLAVSLVEADRVVGAPLGEEVGPFEVGQAERVGGLDPAAHQCPVEGVSIAIAADTEKLGGALHAIGGWGEEGNLDGVLAVAGNVGEVGVEDRPE